MARVDANVRTIFGAIDNTRQAVASATKNIRKVGKSGEDTGKIMSMLGDRMNNLGKLMNPRGTIALGAGTLVGAFGALATQAAAKAVELDRYTSSLGKLGETHGKVLREIGSRYGTEFLPGAEAIARVTGVAELEAAIQQGGALDLLLNTNIPNEIAGQLTANIIDAFGVSLEEAAKQVEAIYSELGSFRFDEIRTGLLRGVEHFGTVDGVSPEDLLGLIRAASAAIQTPDILEEFIEDFGKALGESGSELSILFKESGRNLQATLEAALQNQKAANEFGENSRTQIGEVVMKLNELGDTLEVVDGALLERAKAETDFADALRLFKNMLTGEIDGPLSDAITTLTDAMKLLAGRADLASGDIRNMSIALQGIKGTLNVGANVFEKVTGALGNVIGFGTQQILNVTGSDRFDSASTTNLNPATRVGRRAIQAQRRQAANERNNRILRDMRLRAKVGTLSDTDLANARLLNTPRHEAPFVNTDILGPPSQPTTGAGSGLIDSWQWQMANELKAVKEEVMKSGEMVADEVKMNTENRKDTTQQMLDEQRLQLQGAC